MPRLREFDEAETLDKAMRLFWRRGYADTSVRDIVEFTGVAHAGIYKAFGDKDKLFETALRKYAQDQNEAIYGPLQTKTAGRNEIEEFFKTVVTASKNGRFANGCFIANSAVEFGSAQSTRSAIADLVRDNMRIHAKAFANALKNAKANGEIAATVNVRRVSSGLAAAFYGLSAMSRATAPISMIEQAAAAAIDQLGSVSGK